MKNKENKTKKRSPGFLVHNFGASKNIPYGKVNIFISRDSTIEIFDSKLVKYLQENEKRFQIKVTKKKGT